MSPFDQPSIQPDADEPIARLREDANLADPGNQQILVSGRAKESSNRPEISTPPNLAKQLERAAAPADAPAAQMTMDQVLEGLGSDKPVDRNAAAAALKAALKIDSLGTTRQLAEAIVAKKKEGKYDPEHPKYVDLRDRLSNILRPYMQDMPEGKIGEVLSRISSLNDPIRATDLKTISEFGKLREKNNKGQNEDEISKNLRRVIAEAGLEDRLGIADSYQRMKDLEETFGGHLEMSKHSVGPDLTALPDLSWLPGLTELDVSYTNLTNEGLTPIKGLSGLKSLNLAGTKVTEAGLKSLTGLHELEKLDLGGIMLTGDGLTALKGFSNLTELSLKYSYINDAELALLKGLSKLTELDLAYTNITDSGLKQLQGFKQLTELGLEHTAVTGVGFSELTALSRLEELNLSQTKISDSGLKALKGLPALTGARISALPPLATLSCRPWQSCADL